MKWGILIIFIFIFIFILACAEPSIVNENKRETKIEKNEYPISKTMKIVYQYDFIGDTASTCMIKISDTYIIGMTRNKIGVILTSTDKKNWKIVKKMENIRPYTLSVVKDIVYISAVFGTTSGYIYQSKDKGQTWERICQADNYVIIVSDICKNNKIVLGLYHEESDIMKRYIDFGWLNLSSNKIQNIIRLATANDIPDEYPGEIDFIERGDGAYIAGIRWSDHPRQPFIQLKISYDKGQTWKVFGQIWQGMGGKMTFVKDNNENYYIGGYVCEYVYKYTIAGKWDAYSGKAIEIIYPFGHGSYIENKGNGQAFWDNEGTLGLLAGNGNYKKCMSFVNIAVE